MARRIGAIVAGGLTLTLSTAPGALALPQACTPSPNRDHGWEVVLTHARTQSKAKATLALVQKQSRAKGLKAVIERDGCPDYEVAITGFRTKSQAVAAEKQSKAGFPHASLEHT
ncbi:MAG: hypothetical protein WBB74_00920 [Gaiellaceae bacterium]